LEILEITAFYTLLIISRKSPKSLSDNSTMLFRTSHYQPRCKIQYHSSRRFNDNKIPVLLSKMAELQGFLCKKMTSKENILQGHFDIGFY